MVYPIIIALCVWMVPLLFCCINRFTWTRGSTAPLAQRHRVSILIPARNEARNLQELIESIDYAVGPEVELIEIVVYDDQSHDDTQLLLAKLKRSHPALRVIMGQPLPADWVGKPHALRQLLREARGDYLLFLDADVRLKPTAFVRLFNVLAAQQTDGIVTAVPEQRTLGFMERLIVPLLHLTYTSWLPLALANRQHRSSTVAACGQIMFGARSTFVSLGGFDVVKSAVVDDVALCRHAKRLGRDATFMDGFEVGSCRMYRGGGEVWRGFSKNLYLGIGSVGGLAIAITLYVCAFVLPYAYLSFAVVESSIDPAWALPFWLSIAGVAGNVALRALLIQHYHHPKTSALLHPLAVLLLVALALNSLRWVWSGRVFWAGRSYPTAGTEALVAGSDHV